MFCLRLRLSLPLSVSILVLKIPISTPISQKENARESYQFVKGDEGIFGDASRGRAKGDDGGVGGEEEPEHGGSEQDATAREIPNLVVCQWQNVDIAHNLRHKECSWLRFAFRGQGDGLTVHVPQSIMKRSVALRFTFVRCFRYLPLLRAPTASLINRPFISLVSCVLDLSDSPQ